MSAASAQAPELAVHATARPVARSVRVRVRVRVGVRVRVRVRARFRVRVRVRVDRGKRIGARAEGTRSGAPSCAQG